MSPLGDPVPAPSTGLPVPLGDFGESCGAGGCRARGTHVVSGEGPVHSQASSVSVQVAAPVSRGARGRTWGVLKALVVGRMPGVGGESGAAGQARSPAAEQRGPLLTHHGLRPRTRHAAEMRVRVYQRSAAAEGQLPTSVWDHSDLFSCLSLALQWDLQPRSSWPGVCVLGNVGLHFYF